MITGVVANIKYLFTSKKDIEIKYLRKENNRLAEQRSFYRAAIRNFIPIEFDSNIKVNNILLSTGIYKKDKYRLISRCFEGCDRDSNDKILPRGKARIDRFLELYYNESSIKPTSEQNESEFDSWLMDEK